MCVSNCTLPSYQGTGSEEDENKSIKNVEMHAIY